MSRSELAEVLLHLSQAPVTPRLEFVNDQLIGESAYDDPLHDDPIYDTVFGNGMA